MREVICQKWVESEAGWGIRNDGYSLHPSLSSRNKFVDDYNRTYNNQPSAPAVYSRTEGQPYPLFVTDLVYDTVTDDGIFVNDRWMEASLRSEAVKK